MTASLRTAARSALWPLAAASLALSLALAFVWLRSYWVGGGLAFKLTSGPALYSAYVGGGRLRVDRALHNPGAPYFSHAFHRPPHLIATPATDLRGRLGFWFDATPTATGKARLAVVLPMWVVAFPCFLLSTWLGVRAMRHRLLKRRGRCPRCSYDLRATPQRCPECGHIVRRLAEAELKFDDEAVMAIDRAEDQIDRGEGIGFDQFAAQWRNKLAARVRRRA